MNDDKYISDTMVNQLDTSQDVQAFQRDVALSRLSSITLQQARRNVTIVDNISHASAIEEAFRQTTDMFLQNVDKISKMDIRNEKVDIELNKSKPYDDNLLLVNSSGTLKDKEFIKPRQRENIVADQKTGTFVSPSVPAALDTIPHNIRHKTLCSNEPETSSDRLEQSTDTLPSKMDDSENIGVRNVQIKIPPIDSFTPLEAAALSCVLEECLEQLTTIGFMIPAKVDPRWDDEYKTIDEMYGVPDEPRTIFREDMGLLPLIPTAAEKMQRDRNYVCKVLEKVLHDVRDNGRFDSLQEEISNIAKKQEGEHNLEANTQIWLSQADQLQKLLESDRKANEEDRKRMINLVHESDAQVDHAIFLNSGKLGYVERWAKAGLKQQELKLKLQKTDMLNKLSDYSKEYSAEQVISAEVSAYLEADIMKKEDQIVMWTKKYNEELVQRQQEIDELRKQIEEQKLEMEEMCILIKERQEFIDECITEEKKLQEEAKYQEKLDKAATVIQSAWRAYMVRHELGKYKGLRKRLKRHKKTRKLRKEAIGKKKR